MSSAVQLVGELSQLAHRDAEGGGDSLDRAPGRIGPAALDQGHGAGRDARILGKAFLREATLLAELADCLSEGGLRLVIEEYPALFSVCELAMAIAEDETDDSVKRAVRELVAIPLLYCEKSRLVIPIRTALRGGAILGGSI